MVWQTCGDSGKEFRHLSVTLTDSCCIFGSSLDVPASWRGKFGPADELKRRPSIVLCMQQWWQEKMGREGTLSCVEGPANKLDNRIPDTTFYIEIWTIHTYTVCDQILGTWTFPLHDAANLDHRTSWTSVGWSSSACNSDGRKIWKRKGRSSV